MKGSGDRETFPRWLSSHKMMHTPTGPSNACLDRRIGALNLFQRTDAIFRWKKALKLEIFIYEIFIAYDFIDGALKYKINLDF